MAEFDVNKIAKELAEDATNLESEAEDARAWRNADIPRIKREVEEVLVEVLTPYMGSVGKILERPLPGRQTAMRWDYINEIRTLSTLIKDNRPGREYLAKEELLQFMKNVCDEQYKDSRDVPSAINIIRDTTSLDDSLRAMHLMIMGVTIGVPSTEHHFRKMVDPTLQKMPDTPPNLGETVMRVIDAALNGIGLTRTTQGVDLHKQAEALIMPVFTAYPDYADVVESKDIESLLKQARASQGKLPEAAVRVPIGLHRGPEDKKPNELPLADMAYLPVYNVMTAKYNKILRHISTKIESDDFTSYENRKLNQAIAVKPVRERAAILSDTVDTVGKIDDVVGKIDLNMTTIASMIAHNIERGILEGRTDFLQEALTRYVTYQESLTQRSGADNSDAWKNYDRKLRSEAFQLCVHRECEQLSKRCNLRNDSSRIDVPMFVNTPLHRMLLTPAIETSAERIQQDVKYFSFVDNVIRGGGGQYRIEGPG